MLYGKDKDNWWIYRCVYSLLLFGDLFVGMSNMDLICSKIIWYYWLKELV